MIVWNEPAEHVGLATIDRQERRNALSSELCDDLRRRVEAASALRAVVITGAGSAFCAGADLARRAADTDGGLSHGGGDTFRPAFERLLDAIVACPAPVIAAVNGPALGAGLQLAVACDFRVVSTGAKLGIPASKLGVVLSSANIRRLAAITGHAVARDLLMTGRAVDAAEADKLGLVHRSADDALAVALDLAKELAALAPLTVQSHKRALNLVGESGGYSTEAIAEIEALEKAAFESDDLQEGLTAFGEKRAPSFRGR